VEATETVVCKLHRQVVASVILERLARKGHQPSAPSDVETISERDVGLQMSSRT
jgi:hypothetical protein